MATRISLQEWIVAALRKCGGSAEPIDVAKAVWESHETELRQSGDLFYTWQYDLRWAATRLRKQGVLQHNAPGEPWSLVGVETAENPTRGDHVEAPESDSSGRSIVFAGLRIGERYSRKELLDQFGGQRQSGIVTPRNYPVILLFSSPKGEAFGYADKWDSDGTYLYFGEGQRGSMVLKRGNRAIAEAGVSGRDLLLFTRADGGSGSFEFQGPMACIATDWVDGVPDIDSRPRKAIRFRLRLFDPREVETSH